MAFDSALLTDRELQILRKLTVVVSLTPSWATYRKQLVVELFDTICEQRRTLDAVREFAHGE
jgi:hypothetical protein